MDGHVVCHEHSFASHVHLLQSGVPVGGPRGARPADSEGETRGAVPHASARRARRELLRHDVGSVLNSSLRRSRRLRVLRLTPQRPPHLSVRGPFGGSVSASGHGLRGPEHSARSAENGREHSSAGQHNAHGRRNHSSCSGPPAGPPGQRRPCHLFKDTGHTPGARKVLPRAFPNATCLHCGCVKSCHPSTASTTSALEHAFREGCGSALGPGAASGPKDTRPLPSASSRLREGHTQLSVQCPCHERPCRTNSGEPGEVSPGRGAAQSAVKGLCPGSWLRWRDR